MVQQADATAKRPACETSAIGVSRTGARRSIDFAQDSFDSVSSVNVDLSVVVTTFERPTNLRRVLLALAAQRFDRSFEVIVSDDGSRDETPEVVRQFRGEVDFPVHFVTQPHDGFRPARCRNAGFGASSGGYVVFLDGDCLVPPDFLAVHWARRRPGLVMTGDAYRLDRETSRRITDDVVRQGAFLDWASPVEVRRLAKADWKARLYHWLRHPTKPRILAGNIGIWRDDYQAVNGFDENYVGWGCEDDDFGYRLHRSGRRVYSIRRWTRAYHIWHPRVASAPQRISQGSNIAYLNQRGRLHRCRNGLVKRSIGELYTKITGDPTRAPTVAERLSAAGINVASALRRAACSPSESDGQQVELEILLYPTAQGFSRQRADCRMLVVCDGSRPPRSLVRQADYLCGDVFVGQHRREPLGIEPRQSVFAATQLAQAVDAVS